MESPGSYTVTNTSTPKSGDRFRINPSTYFEIVNVEDDPRFAIEIQSENGGKLQAFIDRDEIEKGRKMGYIVKV